MGELPDGYQAEVAGLMKDLAANVDENHNSYTKAVDKNFRQNAQTPEVKTNPKGGTTVTPKKATPNAPASVPRASGVPAAAEKQYKDKAGNVVGYLLNGKYHALNKK